MKIKESEFKKYYIKNYSLRNKIFEAMKDKEVYRICEIAEKGDIKYQNNIVPVLKEWVNIGIVEQASYNGKAARGLYKMNKNILIGQ